MAKKIELLEVSQRKLLGQGLSSCSLDEILEIDSQLEKSLKSIRARKAQIFQEQIEELKEREKQLLERKCKDTRQWQLSAQPSEGVTYSQSSPSSEVETELFIGLPEMRCS
ncbi:MADS-box protein AGL42 [Vitis vinifera]|uniref:MADS-box protein AGL42 n=1 Tax=Vitis vinifera TaxID=29760 RepID=A0A438GL93_VITVI|nr:MADS-box protein AGL42 [Vitis vinifera]